MRWIVTVSAPRTPSVGQDKMLKIKLPDAPQEVWVDKDGKNFTARFANQRIRDSFARARSKDTIKNKLAARFGKVGEWKETV